MAFNVIKEKTKKDIRYAHFGKDNNFFGKKHTQKTKDIISKKNKKNINYFIEKAKEIHGDKYDYSQAEYTHSHSKIEIICPIHGSFWQKACSHLEGFGCKECNIEKKRNHNYIEKAKEIYGDKYDYSKITSYKNNSTKYEIICKKHGSFFLTLRDHVNKKIECPFCMNENAYTKGEEKIKHFLEKNNIKFIYQKKFDDCKKIKNLFFDFYIEGKNTVIEYDGEQHFFEKSFNQGKHNLAITQERDNIKNNYCFDKKIKIIRISFKEFKNINNILSENIL